VGGDVVVRQPGELAGRINRHRVPPLADVSPELLADPSFATGGQRSRNRKALNERIAAITCTKPGAHWIAALNKAGVPCGPINSIDQTFAEPQVRHSGSCRL
jgi:formyl-CoA transferase